MKTYKDAVRERKMLANKGMLKVNNSVKAVNGCILSSEDAKAYIREQANR